MSYETTARASVWGRLLWMVMFGILPRLARPLLGALAFIQLILMAVNRGKPSLEIATIGKRLGPWMAKPAAFQTAATQGKPWPWARLD